MADGVLWAERGVTGHGGCGSDPRGGPATRAWGQGWRGPKHRGVTTVVPVKIRHGLTSSPYRKAKAFRTSSSPGDARLRTRAEPTSTLTKVP